MRRVATPWLCGIAAAATAAAAIAVPGQAQATSGATKVTPDGPAAKALRQQGVRIGPLKPARGDTQGVSLPVSAGLAGSTTTLLRHRGGLLLEGAGDAEVRLTKLTLLLGSRSRVTAQLGSTEVGLFKVLRGGKREVDPAAGTVQLSGLRIKLTRAGARAIAERLDLDRLRPGRFGVLSSNVSRLTVSGDAPTSATPTRKAAGCQLPSGAGPAPESPLPIAARPGGSADISSATIDWHVRESFIRYIASGEGTSVSAGASADPPVLLPEASTALSYDFHFPFANGWHGDGANPADPADDRAAIYFGGALRFLYSGHGIDLTTAAPEIEIAGGASRAIFAVSEGAGAPARQVLVNLDLSRAAAIVVSGGTHTYERVPGAIPAGTATSVFAGFYAPGTEFGCFTVSYATGS